MLIGTSLTVRMVLATMMFFVSPCFSVVVADVESNQVLMEQGMWKDPATGLIWDRCSLGQSWDGVTCTGEAQTFSWKEAKAAAKRQTLGGHSDWRLPTVSELGSIHLCSTGIELNSNLTEWDYIPSNSNKREINTARFCEAGSTKPTIDNVLFPRTVESWYWTASRTNNEPWYVEFSGSMAFGRDFPTKTKYVRAVRSLYFLGNDALVEVFKAKLPAGEYRPLPISESPAKREVAKQVTPHPQQDPVVPVKPSITNSATGVVATSPSGLDPTPAEATVKQANDSFAMPPAPRVADANAIADALSLNDPTVTAHIKSYQAGIAKDSSFFPRFPSAFKVTTDQGDLYGLEEEGDLEENGAAKELIPARFTSVSRFNPQIGIAIACTSLYECGLINTNGQFVVQPLAASMSDSGNDLETGLIHFSPLEDLPVSTKCGFIGFDGKVKIAPVFKECWHFSEVNSFGADGHINFITPAQVQLADGRWGFILPSGEWAFNELFQDVHASGPGDPIAVKRDGLWGYLVANIDGKSMRYLIEPSFLVVNVWVGSEKDFFFWASKKQIALEENYETDGCMTSTDGYIEGVQECRKAQWTISHQSPVWLYYLCQWLPDGYLSTIASVLASFTLLVGIGWTLLRKQLGVFRWIRFTKTARFLQIVVVVIPLAAFFAAISTFTPDNPVFGGNANANALGVFEWMIWNVLLAAAALPVCIIFGVIIWFKNRRTD